MGKYILLSIFPLWKRGIKGDFKDKWIHKISPNPSFFKEGNFKIPTNLSHTL
jgi:hypothetical protein